MRERERNDLTGEHRFGDAGQAIGAGIFAVVWLVDSFVLEWTTPLNQVIPNAVRVPVGLALLGIAMVLAIRSLRIVFGERRDPPVVIRKDVFSVIRHPMYLSEVLLYAGLLSLSLSIAGAAVFVIVVIFLLSLCRYEERLLIERFGDEYRRYMEEVPMWLPRIRLRRTERNG